MAIVYSALFAVTRALSANVTGLLSEFVRFRTTYWDVSNALLKFAILLFVSFSILIMMIRVYIALWSVSLILGGLVLAFPTVSAASEAHAVVTAVAL